MNNTSVKLDDELVAKVRKMKDKGYSVSGFFNAAGQEKLRGSLISRLKKDKKLFATFQANITMCVMDVIHKAPQTQKGFVKGDELVNLVTEGARKFLELLIDDKKSPAGR